MAGRQGCFVAISRCIWGDPRRVQHRPLATTETIEFENLVNADNRSKAAKAQRQVVTDTEKEIVRRGNLTQLVDEQKRKDAERQAELRRQEEALRMEEEAYYAAKREAARTAHAERKSTPTPPPGTNQRKSPPPGTSQTLCIANGELLPPWLSDTSADTDKPEATFSVTDSKDEDDFDQFLESVKARQLSLATKAPSPPAPPTLVSDDEEEIDFGYWEKATLTTPTDSTHSRPSHEADLDLL